MTNPYSDIPYADRQLVQGRVSADDITYLKSIIPQRYGLLDVIISSLFRSFIQHIRHLEKLNEQPFEPAWGLGDPALQLIILALERVRFDIPAGSVEHAGGASVWPSEPSDRDALLHPAISGTPVGRPVGTDAERNVERAVNDLRSALSNLTQFCRDTERGATCGGSEDQRDEDDASEEK